MGQINAKNQKPKGCEYCGPGTKIVSNGSNNSKYRKVKQWLCTECRRTLTDKSYSTETKSKIYLSILKAVMSDETKNILDVALRIGSSIKSVNKYIYRHGIYFQGNYSEKKLKQKTVKLTKIAISPFRIESEFAFEFSYTAPGFINWFNEINPATCIHKDEELLVFLEKKKIYKYIRESSTKEILLARLAFFIRLKNSMIELERSKSKIKAKSKMII